MKQEIRIVVFGHQIWICETCHSHREVVFLCEDLKRTNPSCWPAMMISDTEKLIQNQQGFKPVEQLEFPSDGAYCWGFVNKCPRPKHYCVWHCFQLKVRHSFISVSSIPTWEWLRISQNYTMMYIYIYTHMCTYIYIRYSMLLCIIITWYLFWFVVWHIFDAPIRLAIIISTDFHIFQRRRYTTKQLLLIIWITITLNHYESLLAMIHHYRWTTLYHY